MLSVINLFSAAHESIHETVCNMMENRPHPFFQQLAGKLVMQPERYFTGRNGNLLSADSLLFDGFTGGVILPFAIAQMSDGSLHPFAIGGHALVPVLKFDQLAALIVIGLR